MEILIYKLYSNFQLNIILKVTLNSIKTLNLNIISNIFFGNFIKKNDIIVFKYLILEFHFKKKLFKII